MGIPRHSRLVGRRTDELRKRDRRVLRWSLGVAAALHVAVFVLFPAFRVEVLSTPDLELDTVGVAGVANATVEVLFGPTIVRLADGSGWEAPSDRVLSADRDVRLPEECLHLAGEERPPMTGRVGLRIKASGRVDVMGLASGTGDPCADGVLSEVAGALWYHWLPNDRAPAPVLVEQPVTLVAAYLAAF